MVLEILCSGCSRSYSLPDEAAGNSMLCQFCGSKIAIKRSLGSNPMRWSTKVPPLLPARSISTKDAKNLQLQYTWFWIIWSLSCTALIIANLIGIGIFLLDPPAGTELSVVVICNLFLISLGVLGIFTANIIGMWMLYNIWGLLPVRHSPTTPAKAVGYLFIPFYNFYWVFVAYLQLGRSLNFELGRDNRAPIVKDGYCIAFCILQICVCLFALIPILNLLTAVFCAAMCVQVFKQLKDAGIAIIDSRVSS